LILLAFVIYSILLVVLFNDFYIRAPFDLFGLEGAMHQ